MGQDPETSTYMEALSDRNIDHTRRSKGQKEDSTSVISLGYINWKVDDVASKSYIIQYGYHNRNVDTDDTLFLLSEWDEKYCMDVLPMFHMRKYYVLKSQSHDTDTPTYMEAL